MKSNPNELPISVPLSFCGKEKPGAEGKSPWRLVIHMETTVYVNRSH